MIRFGDQPKDGCIQPPHLIGSIDRSISGYYFADFLDDELLLMGRLFFSDGVLLFSQGVVSPRPITLFIIDVIVEIFFLYVIIFVIRPINHDQL